MGGVRAIRGECCAVWGGGVGGADEHRDRLIHTLVGKVEEWRQRLFDRIQLSNAAIAARIRQGGRPPRAVAVMVLYHLIPLGKPSCRFHFANMVMRRLFGVIGFSSRLFWFVIAALLNASAASDNKILEQTYGEPQGRFWAIMQAHWLKSRCACITTAARLRICGAGRAAAWSAHRRLRRRATGKADC